MVDAVLTAGQRAAEARMTTTCTISRATGDRDPLTGEPVLEPVYEGRCRVHGDRPYEQTPESGGGTVTVQRYLLSVPVSAGPFEVGDVVEVTAARHQPHLVGRTYRIGGPDERSQQTAQRMFIDYPS